MTVVELGQRLHGCREFSRPRPGKSEAVQSAIQTFFGERPMRNVRIATAAFSLCFAVVAAAQVPTIIKEIDQLESQRDPKCYATANRLEDFIYGTSLDFDARAEKIALQKQLIRGLWIKASEAAKGKAQIGIDDLRPVLQAAVPYVTTPVGDWIILPEDPRRTEITARDKRQY